MGLNVALNAMIGAIPVFGDIFSIWFRSNIKNAHFLERYAGTEDRVSNFGNWIFVIVVIGGIILVLVAILLATAWLIKQLWNTL